MSCLSDRFRCSLSICWDIIQRLPQRTFQYLNQIRIGPSAGLIQDLLSLCSVHLRGRVRKIDGPESIQGQAVDVK